MKYWYIWIDDSRTVAGPFRTQKKAKLAAKKHFKGRYEIVELPTRNHRQAMDLLKAMER